MKLNFQIVLVRFYFSWKLNFPNKFLSPVSISMFTVISTERTQVGKSEKGHYLAKLKLFVLACIYFNTWSIKYRAHLTNFEGTAIFSREIAIAQKASTWNSCRLLLSKMKKKKIIIVITKINFALFQKAISLDQNFAGAQMFAVRGRRIWRMTKSHLLSLQISFQFVFLQMRTLKTRKLTKNQNFTFFCNFFFLSRKYLILHFGFRASKWNTFKKFEICKCLPIIYLYFIKNIFSETRLQVLCILIHFYLFLSRK